MKIESVAKLSKFPKFIDYMSKKMKLASWSSGNAFVSGAGGLRFKSTTGQIEQSVANSSPSLWRF